MGGLFQVTFWITFLGLILAFWLGIYLVTRNPRYTISWLTAATLWSIGGLFFNALLGMDPPEYAYWPAWLQNFLPFWRSQIYTGEGTSWLLGWSIVPATAFWHHATVMLRPGKYSNFRIGRILLGYAIALVAIVVQSESPIVFFIDENAPLVMNTLRTNQWYPIFGIAILFISILSAFNLARSASVAQTSLLRNQLLVLFWTTLFIALVGPLSLVGAFFQLSIPIVELSLAVGIPVGLIGFGVARYSALVEGHTIRRDFLYNLALLSLIVLIYLLASWILIQFYHVPGIILVVVPLLAVITHSLINPAYRLMDQLFFRPSARQLRATLRSITRMAIEGKTMEDNLSEALRELCSSVQATFGLIVIFERQSVTSASACHIRPRLAGFKASDFIADDVIQVQIGHYRHPLENTSLLIPLYAEVTQLGSLLLGCPENGMQYGLDEVERLLNLADQIADVIYIANLKRDYAHQIVELTEAQQHARDQGEPQVPVEDVDSALRNLHDYAYLADSPLAELRLVHARLLRREATHLERGKVLHDILIDAMEKLNPQAANPRDPPPREFHPYLILKEAYREERSNRDIMLHLYISEGTFNRTRRSAIRSIARALGEMEAAIG